MEKSLINIISPTYNFSTEELELYKTKYEDKKKKI